MYASSFIDPFICFIAAGIIVALILFRFMSVRIGLTDSGFRFFGICIIASIAVGFFFAWLFQAVYELIAEGKTDWQGITFLGGLLGGAACFIILSLTLGKSELDELPKIICIAPVSITAAHSLGRVGCFFAGCCYGKVTDSFIGTTFPHYAQPRIPTQLFEAIFLALLFVALMIIIFRFKKPSLAMPVYMYAYGIFRFVLEFWRDDERGVSSALVLSPSQYMSIVMILAAIALTIFVCRKKQLFELRILPPTKKAAAKQPAAPAETDATDFSDENEPRD